MNALVIGGTGLVGHSLLCQLPEHPEFTSIVSLGRSPLPQELPGIDHRVVDLWGPLPDDLQPDVLFCALGTTIKAAGSEQEFIRIDHDLPLHVAREARRRGAAACVVVSSMGADPDARVFYSRVKGQLESDLELLEYPNLSIIRPSLLLGDRNEARPGEEVATLLMQTFKWLIPRTYRAVKASDVAAAMILMAQRPPDGVEVVLNADIHRIAQLERGV